MSTARTVVTNIAVALTEEEARQLAAGILQIEGLLKNSGTKRIARHAPLAVQSLEAGSKSAVALASKFGKQAFNTVRTNPGKTAIASVAIMGVATAAAYSVHKIQDHRATKELLPDSGNSTATKAISAQPADSDSATASFGAAANKWFDAVLRQEMNEETVGDLIEACAEFDSALAELPADEREVNPETRRFYEHVVSYSEQFLSANGEELENSGNVETPSDLIPYLTAVRRTFDRTE